MKYADKIRELLALQFCRAVAGIYDDLTFAELGADELDMYEIVMMIEDEFGIEIQEQDFADEFQGMTISAFITAIEKFMPRAA